jgi:ABC-2 type transport system permease protein
MNAIYILWLRQLKRYMRSRARMIGALGQPLIFLLAFGFGFGPVYHKAEGGDYLQFMVPGVIAMGILFLGVFTGIEMVWDKQFGFLKETFVAPVSRFYIILGRTLGGATVAVLQGVVVLIICLLAGFRMETIWLFPLALIYMLLIGLLCTGIGTAFACILDDMQGFQMIINFLVMPLFFFSNALFPVNELPPALKLVVHLNPLTYGIDGLRGALTASPHQHFGLDLLILGTITAIVLGIASFLFSKIRL